MTYNAEFYDADALFERLTTGVRRSARNVVFLTGSPISAPCHLNSSGVPGVDGVIELIRREFDNDQQIRELEKALEETPNKYQAAFSFLLGRRGQAAANEIIKRAVWKARKTVSQNSTTYLPSARTSDNSCRLLDSDYDGWVLPPAVDALGKLISFYPEYFGKAILTTNFDPLLEVAIGKVGGHYFRTVLHRDGNLAQTEGNGCHVIHLHGYWYGADTLHTPRQLNQPRPRLKASLSTLIKARTLVVSGYGGWDDTFTEALMEIVLDDNAYPEIIWTFNSASPVLSSSLQDRLDPGIDRGRVSLYAGINCHQFFPQLLDKWAPLEPRANVIKSPPPSSRVWSYINVAVHSTDTRDTRPHPRVIEGEHSDRPPLVDICVGRDMELRELLVSQQKVCFITGFGGQGKSTLAAQYFFRCQKEQSFDYYIWRDCKEEGERFENQLISVLARLSEGMVTSNELSHQKIEDLTKLLVQLAKGQKILFVFDNVDHYVDLEKNVLTGNADSFVRAFASADSNCKIVLTCRPFVQYNELNILALKVEGLDSAAAVELFAQRRAPADRVDIEDAHLLTRGHAFWLDLIAAQVAKHAPNRILGDMLNEIRRGGGEIPTVTLRSIWGTLSDKQRLVLRAMAEAVKSEAEIQIAEYLQGQLNFSQVMRALRALRSLNLIVVKPRIGAADVLELHPLVREFIRRTFPKQERLTFIDAIIAVYSKFMGLHKKDVEERMSTSLLQYWSEKAELCVEAGKFQDALDCLAEVAGPFEASALPGEFARAARVLFSQIDWDKHTSYRNFDNVFRANFRILVNLGKSAEYSDLIERYALTVKEKTARYVNYCDLRAYAYWVGHDYTNAIQWAEKGKRLKDQSNVDTQYSTDHHLALAQRDSGIIDPALEYFLSGEKLEKVIDPEELNDESGGPFYGNIGRCLHLMGQIEPALICYRKSAILLQSRGSENVENQGFARKWIGELLIVKGEFCAAKALLEGARMKWTMVSPARIPEIDEIITKIQPQVVNCPRLEGENIERFCIAWIYGREAEFVPL